MTLREGIIKSLYLFSILLLFSSGCKKVTEKENIILIVADDLGWRDVAYNDNDFFVTPALNKLAAEGMMFTNAYSNAPNCAPSRAALMSGLYGPRHGIYTVASAARGKSENRKLIPVENKTVLDTSFVTISEVLKRGGYSTAHMGKWHLGEGEYTGPTGQGFDINVGGGKLGHPKSYFSPYKNKFLKDGPDGENLTDRLSAEAVAYIKRNVDNPFFLYLPYYAVHTPIQGKESLAAGFVAKESPLSKTTPKYGAMVQSMDMGIDSILTNLKKLGIDDRTTIIFISDNGPHFPTSSAEPLRGSKGMLYEGGVRVPMIIKSSNYNGVSETPVIGLDLYPTIMEIAKIPLNEQPIFDGISILDLVKGNQIEERPIFWHFPAYLEASYKPWGKNWRTTPGGSVRLGDWKLIEFFEDSTLELYNLASDISESNNLANDNPEKVLELHNLMKDWRKLTNAFIPTKLNPDYQDKEN